MFWLQTLSLIVMFIKSKFGVRSYFQMIILNVTYILFVLGSQEMSSLGWPLAEYIRKILFEEYCS